MLRALLSVSGFTLLSRVTGFVRDMILAAVLGAGPVSDAFMVAFRLPNHFRAIFAEGAFNAAFVPLYSKIRAETGDESAASFSAVMLSWQFLIQTTILALALLFMPVVVGALAPGFTDDPQQSALAIALTRITFGYLILVTLVTQFSAVLNAHGYFKAAAAAPVLLNLAMIATLSFVALFPDAAHAAAWGVLIGGGLELALLLLAMWASGLSVRFAFPSLTSPMQRFATAFGPAVIGSAGVQIGLFADTILASFLAAGELTSLYYADRINQLPLGVIGVALGTVLLPEMSRRLSQGDSIGAGRAQNRAAALGLFLTLPCMALFLIIPDIIMAGLFSRGAFNADASQAAAGVLQVYAIGLPAFILLRTITPLFHARGDTSTPARATLISIAVNLTIKLILIGEFNWGAEGLAMGTAIGAWVNLCLLGIQSYVRGILPVAHVLTNILLRIVIATAAMAAVIAIAAAPVVATLSGMANFRQEIALAVLGLIAAVSYAAPVLGLGLLQRLR
jgi:putative peptidoglycan lipid II flippase